MLENLNFQKCFPALSFCFEFNFLWQFSLFTEKKENIFPCIPKRDLNHKVFGSILLHFHSFSSDCPHRSATYISNSPYPFFAESRITSPTNLQPPQSLVLTITINKIENTTKLPLPHDYKEVNIARLVRRRKDVTSTTRTE